MLQLRGQHGRSFLDRYRLFRTVLIGFQVSFPLAWVLSPKEAVSLGMLISLGSDAWLICRESWRMNADQTRAFFTQVKERSSSLIERTVALNFIGFGVISLLELTLILQRTPCLVAPGKVAMEGALVLRWL